MAAQRAREVVYRIDGEDRIAWVNPGWDRFAEENGAPELVALAIAGRSIWDFIKGEEVCYLHRSLLERVRHGRHLFDLPFRCDGPDARRFMLMDLWPLPERGVEYHCRLRLYQAREPVALFQPDIPREGEPLRMCAWCRRVELVHSQWVEVEEAVDALELFLRARPPPIEHTICPRDRKLLES